MKKIIKDLNDKEKRKFMRNVNLLGDGVKVNSLTLHAKEIIKTHERYFVLVNELDFFIEFDEKSFNEAYKKMNDAGAKTDNGKTK